MRTTIGNAWRLGLSLVATWSVAVVIRLLLPRHLGPEVFGVYVFAESVAITGLGLLGFGIDAYIQKEVPVRPRHASDFFGGVLVLRTLSAALVLAALVGVLHLTGQPRAVVVVTAVFGVGCWLQNINKTLAALLQANTTIAGLAIANPAAKLAWGVMVGAGIWLGVSLPTLAAAFALSEALRALVLARLVRRELALDLRVDARATLSVLVVSLPLFLNTLALAVNARLDVAVLGFAVADETVVGWYGAAANLAGITLMLVPLVFPLVMPLLSRSLARSPAEFWSILRVTLRILLPLAAPGTLFLALGADVWVRVAFGEEYAPAALALQGLAPQFALTYLAMIASASLILLDRGWALTRSSLTGLALMPVLAVTLIPICERAWGGPGAGLGVALAAAGSELVVTVMVFKSLGSEALDRGVRRTLVRTFLACVLVTGAVLAMAPLGPLRLLVGGVLYVALVVLLGAVPVRQVGSWARTLRDLWRAGA